MRFTGSEAQRAPRGGDQNDECQVCDQDIRLVNAGPDEWSHSQYANHEPQLPIGTAEAVAQFEGQGALQPGSEGWWKVWGASVRHIRTGDLVATLSEDGERELDWMLIQDRFGAKAAPLRQGFVVDGERVTLGALAPVVVLRRGTHNTLAQ